MPRSSQAAATGLSHEAIVDAAAQLLEEGGLEAVTMRRVAERCGASPMSLYRHVATKEELLRAVVERHTSEVALPDTTGLGWRDAITQVVLAMVDAFLAHPRLPEVLALQHGDALNVFRATEVILQSLRDAGLDERESVDALDTLTACATGFVQRRAEVRRRADAPEERLRRILALPREEFPMVAGLAGRIVTVELDHELADGLALVLDGIELRLERKKQESPA